MEKKWRGLVTKELLKHIYEIFLSEPKQIKAKLGKITKK
jgi:hypothetical protein